MKITVLGCGSSGGVPLVGCACPVCRSGNPKNRRTRVSILIETRGKRLLVDTSPDLREQCLRHDIRSVDAVLYTHAHADHIHGIDDLRSLNYHKNGAIDFYADTDTSRELRQRFSYVFAPHAPGHGWYKPALVPHDIYIDEGTSRFIIAEDIEITAFPQRHGKNRTLGFRVGNFVYSTDVNAFPEVSLEVMKGLEIWLVDCLRYDPSPTHAHLQLTLEWIHRLGPRRAVLTHMGHEFDYDTLKGELPPGVEPAFDGMVLHV